MAILTLEEIEENLVEENIPLEEQEDLPLEEMQEVQEEGKALEDATQLLEDMEEAAQQQAVTINNIEGDASEINSVEEGEVIPSVEPEFTQDDIENNPEMVQDIVNEQQAAMEAFAVRITEASGRNIRSKLFGKLGITAVSHESIRVNPFEAYKVTHEGLKETVKVVIKKILDFIESIGHSIMNLIKKFRIWMGQSKKDIEIIKEAERYANNVKSIEFKNTSGLLISPENAIKAYKETGGNLSEIGLMFVAILSENDKLKEARDKMNAELAKTGTDLYSLFNNLLSNNDGLKKEFEEHYKKELGDNLKIIGVYYNGSYIDVLSNIKESIMTTKFKVNDDINKFSYMRLSIKDNILMSKDIKGIVKAAKTMNEGYKDLTKRLMDLGDMFLKMKKIIKPDDKNSDKVINLRNFSKIVSFSNGMTIGYIRTYNTLLKACKAIIKAGKANTTTASITKDIVTSHKQQ